MATSGSVIVAVTSHNNLVFNWRLTRQSIANNTSTVAWAMQLVTDGYGRISSTKSKNWSVTVNGTTYSGTNKIGVGNNATLSLASGSTVITHESDGTKTFAFSFSQEFAISFSGGYVGTKSGKGNGTLTTIPRSSSLTASNGTLNTAQTLKITAANAGFKHKITYSCGSASGYAAGSANEYASSLNPSWTPPLSLASQNRTGTSVSITLKLITYASDGTQIGTTSKVITCAIPASVTPSCTVAVSDAMGYFGKYGGYVQGYSKFKVAITPTIAYGAAIASYSTTADKSAYTKAKFTTGVLKSSGNLTVTATVKDTRGRTGSNKAAAVVLAYTIPAVSKLSVRRCNSDGTANDQGEYTQLTFSGSVTSLNSKNSATYVLKYKKKTDTSYTSVVLSNYTGAYSVADGTYIFATDSSYTYDIQLAITDDFSTSSKSTTVSTGFTIMSFLASGLGMAIGKVAELANYLDIAFKTRFRDNIALDNDKTIYGYDADGKLHSALIPWNANGNTVLGIGTYNAESGYTNIYGNRIQILAKGGYIPVKGALGFSFENCADLYWEDASGTGHNCMNLNENNTLDIGYGLWNTGTGNTNVRGNTLELYAKSGATRLMGSDLRLDNGRRLYWLDTSGTEHNCLQLNTSNDLVLGYGGYSAGVGGTHIYGADVKFGIKNAKSASYTPYYRKGDSITLEYMVTSGYITNSKQSLYFIVPLSKPVIGSPTVTATSVSGFILRQDDNYTHGSSSDTFVTPTSYITKLTEAGIYIGATFSNTKNAVNNAPIGVHWSGKITFS